MKNYWPTKVELFGIGVSPTNYRDLTRCIVSAARDGVSGVVSCHAVHALVASSVDAKMRQQANQFDVITPDGQPIRWALNLIYGTRLTDRVYGPKLTLEVCQAAADAGVSVYFYGGSEIAVQKMADHLQAAYPTLKIAGFVSPPFRELTTAEDDEMVAAIHRSGAQIVFIGLGFPKQDVFASEHQGRINAVQICVGAAFDFHAGTKRMAPAWMQRNGLEWLFRLSQEPSRLWKRYLVTNSLFLWKVALAVPGIRRSRVSFAKCQVGKSHV